MKSMNTLVLAAVVALSAVSAFGELPGLPAPEGADMRGGEPAKAPVVAQSGPVRGSLFRQGAAAAANGPVDGQGGLTNHTPISFISVEAPQPKRYRKNDLVTIVIREDSDAKVDGKGNAKKSQDFDFGIQQFLQLALSASGIPTVGTVGDPSKLPEIKFKYSNDRKADAQQERQDSFSARITASVVDVKPNGTMEIQAVKEITLDKEIQVFTLSGVCRVEDIGTDNTLLSTQLADLHLSKQTKGEVRDATKRGWMNKFIDKVSPF